MVDPSDLNVKDLEDKLLPVWIQQYLAGPASVEDWTVLLAAIRDLGYHLGYTHGMEDERSGMYGKRGDFTPAAEPVWERDNLLIPAVLELAGIRVYEESVPTWSDDQCKQAWDWAVAVHVQASDHREVQVPPYPEFLTHYLK